MSGTNLSYFRSSAADAPGTSHTLGTKQSTFNPGRFYNTPRRRYQLPTKGVLKNTSDVSFTHPHAYQKHPIRLKKKENAITVPAYPVTQEREFDITYPVPNEKGQVAIEGGIQNTGRRDKYDMTRYEYPLVPFATPRLNLSKVNFQKDFFRKDYRVNGEVHDDPYFQGYDQKRKKLDFRYLDRGEEEKLEYLDAPVNENNFTAPGTKDYNRLMSHRAPVIHDSHGAPFDRNNPNVPSLYSNINYGDERTQ